jgi:hypothetical protein
MNSGHGTLPALGFGLGYGLAGTALLLQELDVLALRWSFVLPLILLTVGLVVLVSALVDAHRAARIVDRPRFDAEEAHPLSRR